MSQSKKTPYAVGSRSLADSMAAEDSSAAVSGKKHLPWAVFLLLWMLVLLIAGTGVCYTLYRYLGAYEVTLPEHVMDSLMADMPAEKWLAYAKDGLSSSLCEFENADDLFEEYSGVFLAGKDFLYRKEISEDRSVRQYGIWAGGVRICGVTLVPADGAGAGFGLHHWQVGSITPGNIAEKLTPVAVEITAPSGVPILINGKQVSGEYAIESTPYSDLSPIEKRFPNTPECTLYRVEPMYGSISVTLSDGSVLTPTKESTDSVSVYSAAGERYSIKISAPEDVIVTLCGTELTRSDASSITDGVLSGLEDFLGDSPLVQTCIYSFDGLYTLPEVSAVDADGNVLTPVAGTDGSLTFFHANNSELEDSALATVNRFFSYYINYSSNPFTGSLSITREMLNDPEADIDPGVRASMCRYYYLLDTVHWKSELYKYIMRSTDAMTWASSTSVSYNDLTYTDFSYAGDNVMICTVRYAADFTSSPWSGKYTYTMENAYELVFARTSPRHGWYAWSMTFIGG